MSDIKSDVDHLEELEIKAQNCKDAINCKRCNPIGDKGDQWPGTVIT